MDGEEVHEVEVEPALEPEDDAPAPARLVARTDQAPKLVRAAKALRSVLPGDSELGDPLSTAGDRPSHLLARGLVEAGPQRPSVARELGLGALQVWQALSEAQGRGRGATDLAILFTDLVDFSSWALKAGDEAVLVLLRRVGAVSEAAITDRHGQVVKRLGDGLMAVFVDTGAAIDAAHEAVAAVAGVEVDGYQPQLRAGVHLGRPRKLGSDYLGVDVNVAARVADAASGGQVLVSGTARERVDLDAYRFKRVRRFRAKGAPKDLEVYAAEPA